MKTLSIDECCALALEHGLGIPANLIIGLMEQESGRQPGIVSKAGAVGLMQIVQHYHPKLDLTDPEVNVKTGCHVLASNFYYLNHIRSGLEPETRVADYAWDDDELTERALMAYYAGAGTVDYFDSHPEETIGAGIVHYASNIIKLSKIYYC